MLFRPFLHASRSQNYDLNMQNAFVGHDHPYQAAEGLLSRLCMT